MVEGFRNEERCRYLLEQMVWPRGRICPACGFRESIALAGRDTGAKARPGLYQCSNGVCRHQFTMTTHTPLHVTKLPLWPPPREAGDLFDTNVPGPCNDDGTRPFDEGLEAEEVSRQNAQERRRRIEAGLGALSDRECEILIARHSHDQFT
jgi:hypothetical protein